MFCMKNYVGVGKGGIYSSSESSKQGVLSQFLPSCSYYDCKKDTKSCQPPSSSSSILHVSSTSYILSNFAYFSYFYDDGQLIYLSLIDGFTISFYFTTSAFFTYFPILQYALLRCLFSCPVLLLILLATFSMAVFCLSQIFLATANCSVILVGPVLLFEVITWQPWFLAIFLPVIIQNCKHELNCSDGNKNYISNCLSKLHSNHMPEKSNSSKMAENAAQKTTTGDQQKRYRFIQKLTSHNPQTFREIDIDEYDINITQNFVQLQYVDDVVTPLIYCAHFGLKEICRHLLKNKKIDVDLETENNRQTPLIVACMRGNYQIARLLILAGAEVNKPNSLNHTPLAVVIYRLAEEPQSFQNSLLCFRLADFLVDHGADVNWVVDKNRGYTLLHYFCSLKIKMGKPQMELNQKIIKFLLSKGADPSQKTLKDQTAYKLLEKHCNREVIFGMLKEAQEVLSVTKKKKQIKQFKKMDSDYFKLPTKKIEDLEGFNKTYF